MRCEYIVAHRLSNAKPGARHERCGKTAYLRKFTAYIGLVEVWLCEIHCGIIFRHVHSEYAISTKKVVDVAESFQ